MHYFPFFCMIMSFFVLIGSCENDFYENDFTTVIVPIVNEEDFSKKTKIDMGIYEHREWVLAITSYRYRISLDRTLFLKKFFTYASDIDLEDESYEEDSREDFIKKILMSEDSSEISTYFLQCFRTFLVIDEKEVENITSEEKERMYNAAIYSIFMMETLDLSGVHFSRGTLPHIVTLFVKYKKRMLQDILLHNDFGQHVDPYKRSSGTIKKLILRDCNLKKLPEDFWDLFPSLRQLDLSDNALSKIPDFTDNYKEKMRCDSYKECALVSINVSNNLLKEVPVFTDNNYFFPVLQNLNIANNKMKSLQLPFVRDPYVLPKTPFTLNVCGNPLHDFDNVVEDHCVELLQKTFPQLFITAPTQKEDDILPIRFGKLSIDHQGFLHFILDVLLTTKKIKHIITLDISGMTVEKELLKKIAQCASNITRIYFGPLDKRAWKWWYKELGKKITRYVKRISFSGISNIPENYQAISSYNLEALRIIAPGTEEQLNRIQLMCLLKKIVLTGIPLTREFLKKSKDMPYLHDITFNNCDVTNTLVKKMVKYFFKNSLDCRVSRLIVMHNPDLTEVHIPILPPSVHHMDLSNNALIEFTVKQSITKWTVPGVYYHGSNSWTDFVMFDTQEKVCHRSLEYLNLSGNNLFDVEIILKTGNQLKKLKTLDLSGNMFDFWDGEILTDKKKTYCITTKKKEGDYISLHNGKILSPENPFTQHDHVVVYAINQRQDVQEN